MDSSRTNTGQTHTATAIASRLRRTPGLLLGPFYPLHPDQPVGARLWHGKASPANRPMRVQVRINTEQGLPVQDVLVEIWHADGHGRYRHPGAPGCAEVDLCFAGYGAARSDAAGHCCFETVLPGAYEHSGVERAPHLHLQVTGRSQRLVTQFFLPGHPLNAADRWYRATQDPERLVLRRLAGGDEAHHCLAEIVLADD